MTLEMWANSFCSVHIRITHHDHLQFLMILVTLSSPASSLQRMCCPHLLGKYLLVYITTWCFLCILLQSSRNWTERRNHPGNLGLGKGQSKRIIEFRRHCLINLQKSYLLVFLLWYLCACVCLVAQSCTALCDPMNCSLPGSSVHVILQARILE